MIPSRPGPRLGDHVEIEVIEVTDDDHMIVSLMGRLFRTRTQINMHLHAGDRLHVKVTAIEPLRFQILKNFGFERSI